MSEFGRGYATALVQFHNHRDRLDEMVEGYARLGIGADAVEMWANGASDHLYELERPEGLGDDDWARADRIQARALDIGHGFRATSHSTSEEARGLLAEAAALLASIEVTSLEDALAWDAAHGLTPEKGEWSCPLNIRLSKAALR